MLLQSTLEWQLWVFVLDPSCLPVCMYSCTASVSIPLSVSSWPVSVIQPLVMASPFCLRAPAGTVLEEGVRADTSQLPSQRSRRSFSTCTLGQVQNWHVLEALELLNMCRLFGDAQAWLIPWASATLDTCNSWALHTCIAFDASRVYTLLSCSSTNHLPCVCAISPMLMVGSQPTACIRVLFPMCAIHPGISMKPQLCARAAALSCRMGWAAVCSSLLCENRRR